MNLNQQQQPAIDISQTFKIACECGHSLFEQSFALRKVSSLVTGTGQEAIIPIQLFTCKKCGTILKSTIPPELKGLDF